MRTKKNRKRSIEKKGRQGEWRCVETSGSVLPLGGEMEMEMLMDINCKGRRMVGWDGRELGVGWRRT
jgi:hypothetical protein